MEKQLHFLAPHLLHHTLKSFCIQENSQWIYAVFWRILPRNYPQPKWDFDGAPDVFISRSRRNWILVWEDGFYNFASSKLLVEHAHSETSSSVGLLSTTHRSCEFQSFKSLQPQLFFKMSHEIYNYNEDLIGNVAAEQSHKWVFKEPQMRFSHAWKGRPFLYPHPRTWEDQFQSGIETIALVAVNEGVIQLGAIDMVEEDLNFVALLRKEFNLVASIPGVLLPRPSFGLAFKMENCNMLNTWPYQLGMMLPQEFCYFKNQQPLRTRPCAGSFEALFPSLPIHKPMPADSLQESPPIVLDGRPLEPRDVEKEAEEKIDEVEGFWSWE